MIRGVIFDLDGTLGDTLPVCYKAFSRVLSHRLGREFSNQQIHAMFGPSEEGILQRLCPDDTTAALEEYLEEYRAAHVICPHPFEGIREILDRLQEQGTQLAVVTGKGPGSAKISLELLGLAGKFSSVEAGSPTGGVKPEAMQRVIEDWKFPRGEVASVGDAPSDISSARQVGIKSAAAAWASGADAVRLESCRPDVLFHHVAGFSKWIESTTVPLTR